MRVKRAVHARKKKNAYFAEAKGHRGSRRNLVRHVKESVERAWCYAYRDRRNKKREFRRLWIVRINAACREHGLSYSQFIDRLKKHNIELDRKMLASMVFDQPESFSALVKKVSV